MTRCNEKQKMNHLETQTKNHFSPGIIIRPLFIFHFSFFTSH